MDVFGIRIHAHRILPRLIIWDATLHSDLRHHWACVTITSPIRYFTCDKINYWTNSYTATKMSRQSMIKHLKVSDNEHVDLCRRLLEVDSSGSWLDGVRYISTLPCVHHTMNRFLSSYLNQESVWCMFVNAAHPASDLVLLTCDISKILIRGTLRIIYIRKATMSIALKHEKNRLRS